MSDENKDQLYMQRVFELASRGSGKTSPNPMVGCVIVKDGHVIAEGFHHRYGEKHAEIDAIEKANTSVEGATLYCNLEPCCNGIPGKKTPPCTNRIIQEKIKKVVISTLDPNPYVAGKGIQELQEAGVEVVVGIGAEQAVQLNEAYFKYRKTGLPFVHLKIAQTLDGRIATATGDSKWITSPTALNAVHELRYRADAILVGLNTVIQDNPFLTQRLYPDKQPFRIILDEKLKIPPDVHVLNDQFKDKTILVTTPLAPRRKVKFFTEKMGIRVLEVEANEKGLIDLFEMLHKVARLPVTRLLVEGGAQIFTSFIREKLVDKITVFMAPKILGKGIEAIQDLGITQLNEALIFHTTKIENLDGQVVWELVQGEGHVHRNH